MSTATLFADNIGTDQHYAFVATDFIDWRRTYLVYVKAPNLELAASKLTYAGYLDWKRTERPSAYSHLATDEVGYSANDPEIIDIPNPNWYWEENYPNLD